MMKSNTRTISFQAACLAVFSLGGLGCPTPSEEDGGVDAALAEDATDLPDASLDAATTDDAAVLGDVPLTPIDAGPPDAYCNCDDGIACTIDSCVGGRCMNAPDHTRCMEGQFCGALIGCTTGQACSFVGECPPVADCFAVGCTGMCTYTARDRDNDGHTDARCGGDDCNDLNGSTYPGAEELCDGVEQDCGTDGDPPDARGCDPSATCISGRCTCIAPATDVCAPQGVLCADRMTDERAGGGCGLRCDGTCTAGVCTCGAGETACVTDETLTQCFNTATTAAHCGACGRACLTGAGCAAGTCSVEALSDWRVFGVLDSFSPPAVSARRDSLTGRAAVRFSAGRNFYAFPRVAPRLFFVDAGILTHASDGTLLHFFPEVLTASPDYAISGDALWVLVAAGGTFGGVTFPAGGCSLARFDAATGAPLGSRNVGSCSGRLDSDGEGGVVLYTAASPGADFGGGPLAGSGAVIARYAADGTFRSAFRVPLEIASDPSVTYTPTGIVIFGTAPAAGATLGGVTYMRFRRVAARFGAGGDFLNAFEVTGSATQFFATSTHAAACGSGMCQLYEFVGTSAFLVDSFPLGTVHDVASSGTSLWLATSFGVTRVDTITGTITESVSIGRGVLSFHLEAPNRAAVVLRTERAFEAAGVLQPAGQGYGLGHLGLTP